MGDDRPYPDNAVEFLRGKGFTVLAVEATRRAIELGNHRAANVVLLGVLAALLDLPTDAWDRTLASRIPQGLLELNRQAFAAGRSWVASASDPSPA